VGITIYNIEKDKLKGSVRNMIKGGLACLSVTIMAGGGEQKKRYAWLADDMNGGGLRTRWATKSRSDTLEKIPGEKTGHAEAATL